MKFPIKLLFIMIISITIFSSVFLVFSLIGQRQFLLDELEGNKGRTAILAQESLNNLLWEVDIESMEQILITFLNDPNISYVRLYDEIVKLDLVFGDRENLETLQIQEVAILQNDNPIGYVVFGYTMKAIQEQLGRARNQTLLFTVLGMVVSSCLLLLLSSQTMKPIRQLIMASKSIAAGNWDTQLQKTTSDEIGTLTEGFITMQNAIRNHLEALSNTQAYIGEIFNSMPSCLIALDDNGTITQWNKQAAEQFQRSASVSIGQDLYSIIPDFPVERQAVMNCIRNKIGLEEKKKNIYSAVDHAIVDVVLYPIKNREQHGVVIRIDDVTENIRMEQMIIQTEKMVSLGGLAAGFAHEINNPLAGILQTSYVLANRLYKKMDLPANIKAAEKNGISLDSLKLYLEERGVPDMLHRIEESGSRAARIVQDMLSFSRKSQQDFSLYDMESVIESVLMLAATDYNLKKHYDFKKITIKKNIQPKLEPVLCDRGLIQQVLFNIIKNAAEAMYDANIEEPVISVFLGQENDDSISIRISDNGPGISDEDKKRIFDPFFTTKPVGAGTGLGLSVSFFIIEEKHHGKLTVSSEEGKGTTFAIILPVKA